MTTMTYTEELEVVHCWCGIAVGIPTNLARIARDNGTTDVHCPLGHTFGWYKNSNAAKLERERELRQNAERRAKATRDLLAQEERSHSATRGHLTRAKKRSAAGTCPCCKRTFQQLTRHMASQHPEFVEEQRATG